MSERKRKQLTYPEFWSSVRNRIRLDCSYDKENPKTYNKDLFVRKTKEMSTIAKRLWKLYEKDRARSLNLD